jgi:hypothetical protein
MSDVTEDLFEMANLFPAETGLPMTVWVSPRGRARHDARIKVHMTYGNSMDPTNTAVVGIRPAPHLIAGNLDTRDLNLVTAWVQLNRDTLIAYWDGQIGTIQMARQLRKLP